jgi:hypothetical protein
LNIHFVNSLQACELPASGLIKCQKLKNGARFRVQGSQYRVHGAGFTIQGSRFRVQGSGFTKNRVPKVEKTVHGARLKKTVPKVN